MQYNPTTTKETIQRAIIYAAMTLAVIVAATVMVLLTLGYRFDRADNTIEQIGLVQYASQPSGATVKIEGTSFNKTTSGKTTLREGLYTFEMELDGYRSWRKQVPVKSGQILWLTYPRLLPKQLNTKSVASIKNLVSSLPSSDKKYVAVTTTGPNLLMYDITSPSDIKNTSIRLEKSDEFKQDQPRYEVTTWDVDSDYVVVKRTVKDDDKPQWLVVDRRDKSVVNLNSTFGINPTDVQFQPSDSRYLYVLTSGELRRVDINDKNMSRVIASNVYDYSIHESTVIFTTYDNKTRQRTTGVFQQGKDVPVVLETAQDGPGQYHAVMGEYYGDTYVAISSGEDLRIYSGRISSLGQNQQIEDSFKLAYESSLNSNVQQLSLKTNGRFVVAELQGGGFSVYDIEMQRLTTADNANLSGWLDGYLTYDDHDSKLSIREFDGGNERNIGSVVSGQAVTFDNRERYMYWIEHDKKSGNYTLMSTALRI